jgi:broad specificity phosphatase PhoE
LIDAPSGSVQIVIVRHGETDWNADGRFQGHLDVPLNDAGVLQAQRAAAVFAPTEPVHLVSSDLGRAKQTADILATALGMKPAHDPDFRESFGGRWEGLLRNEIIRDDGEQFLGWIGGQDVRAGHTGELLTEVAARMLSGFKRHLADVPEGGTLVVVTHGGAARCAIGALTGLPPQYWRTLGVLSNCAAARLTPSSGRDGEQEWRLAAYNV